MNDSTQCLLPPENAMQRQIYLDYAAATPMDAGVLQTMQPYFTEQFYNPSASYLAAQTVSQALAASRATIAHHLGAKTNEIIFTAGGTEADNLAISGVLRQYPDTNVIVSAIEHDAILQPATQFNYRTANVNAQGIVDVDDLLEKIDDKTVLVSVMYANNEVGTIQPLRRISAGLEQIRKVRSASSNSLPLYFHTDACQATNYLDLHVARLGVDMMTINGSKIYGPKQSGALYVRSGVLLAPLIRGGGQERNLRSGTENVAACIGLAQAVDLVQATRHDESKRLAAVQQVAFSLIKRRLPYAIINGSERYRLPNNLHLTMPGHDNERLLMELDARGVLAAAGSACSAASDEPSHVLAAMGFSEDHAQSSLRLTMGRITTEADIQSALRILAELTT